MNTIKKLLTGVLALGLIIGLPLSITSIADPPPFKCPQNNPNCNTAGLPPVFCFKITNKRLIGPKQLAITFEVLNWTDKPANELTIAVNIGNLRAQLINANVDPTRGFSNGQPNNWAVTKIDKNKAMVTWSAGTPGTPLPNINIIQGANVPSPIDSGPNRLDGFRIIVAANLGAVINFNWFLSGSGPIGKPLPESPWFEGNPFGFGTMALVRMPGPDVSIENVRVTADIDDSAGNGNEVIDPLETIRIIWSFNNQGTSAVSSFSYASRVLPGPGVPSDAIASQFFGDLIPGDKVDTDTDGSLVVEIPPGVPIGTRFNVEVSLFSGTAETGQRKLGTAIATFEVGAGLDKVTLICPPPCTTRSPITIPPVFTSGLGDNTGFRTDVSSQGMPLVAPGINDHGQLGIEFGASLAGPFPSTIDPIRDLGTEFPANAELTPEYIAYTGQERGIFTVSILPPNPRPFEPYRIQIAVQPPQAGILIQLFVAGSDGFRCADSGRTGTNGVIIFPNLGSSCDFPKADGKIPGGQAGVIENILVRAPELNQEEQFTFVFK